MSQLLINLEEIISCAFGNLEEKNKVLEPSIKCSLKINAYYIIMASSRNEIRKYVSISWGSYSFVFEENILKRFVHCHAFIDSDP